MNARFALAPAEEGPILPDVDPAPPPGWERMPVFGPFHQHLGPMFWQRVDGAMRVGLRVQDKHRNRGAMMHGGMVCTLADSASHWAARHARPEAGLLLTIALNVSLMGNAAPGEWVEARVDVLRAGKSVVFTDCRIVCGERMVAQASAQFTVVGQAA